MMFRFTLLSALCVFGLMACTPKSGAPSADQPKRAVDTKAQAPGAKTAEPKPALQTAFATKPTVPFRDVFVLGDFGTGGAGQRQVAGVLRAHIADAQSTLLLTTGDNFYPAGVTSIEDPKWKLRIEDVYKDFGVLMYATLGNHDHRGNVDAQVEYTKHSDMWKMPARYYAFTEPVGKGTTVRFVALDTTRLRTGEDPAQETWLAAELTERRATYTIVFGHHPVYSAGPHGDDEAFRKVVEPLLQSDVVDVYLAGHDHILEVVGQRSGVLHLVCGGGAGDDRPYPIAGDPGTFAMTGGGFMRLRVTEKNIEIGLISDEGELKFTHALAPSASPPQQGTKKQATPTTKPSEGSDTP